MDLSLGKGFIPTRRVSEGQAVPRSRVGLGLKQQAGERGSLQSECRYIRFNCRIELSDSVSGIG
jgi:hypothetical protein